MTVHLSVFVKPLKDRLDLLLDSPVRSYDALKRLAEDIAILRKPDGLIYVGAHEDMYMLNQYLLNALTYVNALSKGALDDDTAHHARRYMFLALNCAAVIEVHGMPTGSLGEWQEVSTVAGARMYEKVTVSTTYSSKNSPFGRWMSVDRISTAAGDGIEVWTPMDPSEIRR